jgi:DNA-directed RNA polymerase II subunit RPB2
VAILFRALGCISDKQILNKIVYDPNDSEMCEALRPSLEEAMAVMTEEDALDFIAGRGAASSYTRERRIQYAQNILETECLPHISTTKEGVFRKSFFVGYMVNRLI